ncbi:MAG: hypothetical protein QXH91_06530, partial [Candidatus Bathyarchaeia archaeon]
MKYKKARKLSFFNAVLIFIVLSVIVCRSWFGGMNYIHQIDSRFKLNPERALHGSLFFWKDEEGLGYPSPDFVGSLFYFWHYSIFLILNFITEDYWQALIFSQFIFYLFTVFSCLFGSYLLFRELLSFENSNIDRKFSLLIQILIPIIYTFNQHSL